MLNKLRKSSNGGYQKIIYHCRKSIAYADLHGNLTNAIIIKGSNDQLIFAQHNIYTTYKVLKDECKVIL